MVPDHFPNLIRKKAFELGFDQFGICAARIPVEKAKWLKEFVKLERHGTMQWMVERQYERSNPNHLWSEAQTAIVLGVNYGPNRDPLENLNHPERGNISVYARNRDYHGLIKGWMKHLAQYLLKEAKRFAENEQVKVFVDTAPIMEKPLAQQAGLGWQGKHTNLVSRQFGSWLFLGEILTTLFIPPLSVEKNHCGTCKRCIESCPTDAFPAPYQLDAKRCISYLTIEHEGPIPTEFRTAIRNRIYGCDDCLAVCPWNRFAHHSRHLKLQAKAELLSPTLHDFVQFDETQFKNFFAGSPIKRIGHIRFIRNVLIAIGNSREKKLFPFLKKWDNHENAILQETAHWAIKHLTSTL